VLYGSLYADGTEDWWIGETWFDPQEATPGHSVRFFGSNGMLGETTAVHGTYEHSEDEFVIAPVPADFDLVTGLEWTAPTGLTAVDVDAVQTIENTLSAN
jgi:hypothetical protein